MRVRLTQFRDNAYSFVQPGRAAADPAAHPTTRGRATRGRASRSPSRCRSTFFRRPRAREPALPPSSARPSRRARTRRRSCSRQTIPSRGRHREVALLAYNEQTVGPQTEQVLAAAEQAELPVVSFSELLPEGEDYLGWMTANLDAVEAALA